MPLRMTSSHRKTWDSEALRVEAIAIAEDALILTGEALVQEIKDQPLHSDLPYDTGALMESIRLAPPGYSHNDLQLVNPNGYGPDTPNYPLAGKGGTTRRYAMETQRRSIDPNASLGAAIENSELVETTPGKMTTWLGSFLPYSWYQHQGFNHIGRAKAIVAGMSQATGTVGRSGVFFPPGSTAWIDGRPYISNVADARGQDLWVTSYRRARGNRLLRGA